MSLPILCIYESYFNFWLCTFYRITNLLSCIYMAQNLSWCFVIFIKTISLCLLVLLLFEICFDVQVLGRLGLVIHEICFLVIANVIVVALCCGYKLIWRWPIWRVWTYWEAWRHSISSRIYCWVLLCICEHCLYLSILSYFSDTQWPFLVNYLDIMYYFISNDHPQGKPWPVSEWKFYIAFSLFRGASIFAGVYHRWTLV